jgi:hypothetical protein
MISRKRLEIYRLPRKRNFRRKDPLQVGILRVRSHGRYLRDQRSSRSFLMRPASLRSATRKNEFCRDRLFCTLRAKLPWAACRRPSAVPQPSGAVPVSYPAALGLISHVSLPPNQLRAAAPDPLTDYSREACAAVASATFFRPAHFRMRSQEQ